MLISNIFKQNVPSVTYACCERLCFAQLATQGILYTCLRAGNKISLQEKLYIILCVITATFEEDDLPIPANLLAAV